MNGTARHFGLAALLPHALHGQIAEHGGVVNWAKANPGMATAAATVGAVNILGGSQGLAGDAARSFNDVIQPAQFGQH